jgi:hypothetical protein
MAMDVILFVGVTISESLPADLAAAHALILAERAARVEAQARLFEARVVAANARADLSSTEALISHLKLEIEKRRPALYGHRSERNARRGKQAAAISPIALETVRRIDALFDIERGINGQSAEERLRVRREQSAPLLAALQTWLRERRVRLSNASSVAKLMDYMLRRWERFARFIDDGRICLTNNAAERALRGFALGRKSWLFAGSERGAERAAIIATLIMTAKLDDVDPQAWLADVLARIAEHPANELNMLLPWNWRKRIPNRAEAA